MMRCIADSSEMFGPDAAGSSFDGRDFSDNPDGLIDIAIRQLSAMQNHTKHEQTTKHHQSAKESPVRSPKPASGNIQISNRTKSSGRGLLQDGSSKDWEIFSQVRTSSREHRELNDNRICRN